MERGECRFALAFSTANAPAGTGLSLDLAGATFMKRGSRFFFV